MMMTVNFFPPTLARFARWVSVLLLAVTLLAIPAHAAGWEERFEAALAAYKNADFASAHDDFYILATDRPHPDLYFNAGNAAFSAGQYADAALRYREALVLDPGHSAARQNLALTESSANAVKGSLDSQTVLPRVSLDTLIIFANVLAWVAVLAGAVYLARMLRHKPGLGIPAGVAGVSLVLALVTGAIAFQRWEQQRTQRPAVVMAAATAFSEPSETTAKLADLPPATSILVLSSRGDWLYAMLPNGTNAWVRSAGIQQVPRREELVRPG